MPDVIEVIGVQVRGSIIAEHLHIDVHSDIGSGPSSSQGSYCNLDTPVISLFTKELCVFHYSLLLVIKFLATFILVNSEI